MDTFTSIIPAGYITSPIEGNYYGWRHTDGVTYPVQVTKSYTYADRPRIAVRAVGGRKLWTSTNWMGLTFAESNSNLGAWPRLVELDTQPETILDLALVICRTKKQWFSGESIQLVDGDIFLSNDGDTICLHRVGVTGAGCRHVVAFLNLLGSGGWEIVRNVTDGYSHWVAYVNRKRPAKPAIS